MNRKILAVLMGLMLLPTGLFAGLTGKITGYVTDKGTGQPLPGVNVIVKGTLMGAATDSKGFYIIMNIPVGTYTVKANFIGYTTVDKSNIRVHPDLTTEVDFQMSSTVLMGKTISIVAERPIINKNITSSIQILQASDLRNIPMRGVQSVLNLSSAVVQVGGNFHVRGGRSEENVTYVDGVMTTLLRGGTLNGLTVISNAIEESDFHAGGFNAEYGFANSGILVTTLKSGGSQYHFSLEGISDELFKNRQGTTLGTRSWGYNTYTVTAGGPIPGISGKKLRFFVAGERDYNHGRARFWQGIQLDTVLTSFGKAFPLKVNYGPGPYPGYFNNTWDINGNITYTPSSAFRIRMGGTYHAGKDRNGGHWNDIVNYYKNQLNKRWNASAYLKFTHQLSPRMFYVLNLNYFYYNHEFGDPDLWSDIAKYGDPKYDTGLRDWGLNYNYSLFGLLNPELPGQVTSRYGKTAQVNMGPKFDLIWQFNDYNELKAGFQYDYYLIRRYVVNAAPISLGLHRRAINPDNHNTDYDIFRNNYGYYGYDIWGRPINKNGRYKVTDNVGKIETVNGHDAPRHPVRSAVYIQDKIELKDLILNAGLRLDHFESGVESWKDPARLVFNNANLLADKSFGPQKVYNILSPRLGWSFPVTDMTVFHAQFGRFVQMPRVDDMYDGHTYVARFLQGGNARTMPNPNLRPMRTVQYEVGLQQQIGMNTSLKVTVFYKDIKDFVQIRVFFPQPGYGYASFFQYQNVDFGTTKGVHIGINLRRTRHFRATVDYTYSKAMGTGSSSGSHFDIAWQDQKLRFPTVIMPLTFNQDNVANIDVDFRLKKNEGPTIFGMKPFENFGINVYYTMHSGSRYTKIEPGPRGLFPQNGPAPLESLNASVMPWYHRVDMKIDRLIRYGRFNFRPYLWVYNVFNRKNVIGVFDQTGAPHDNGWFLTSDGKAWLKIHGKDGAYIARQDLSGGGARNLGTPRILRFGMLISF
ncbi:TonB dependent receptor [bacterium BMS3Abin05]|nr:TonB dependent receptor [bacterium BMS3Abin05]GBE28287.1 TonB dependent receptor [bacterium BMS3Bbin03]